MKKNMTILGLVLMSSTVFASSKQCESAIVAVAEKSSAYTNATIYKKVKALEELGTPETLLNEESVKMQRAEEYINMTRDSLRAAIEKAKFVCK